MPIVTFRGERTVAELADKLFIRLTAGQREKAEVALLKANPQLRDIDNVPEGAILHVPELPEVRAKTNRNPENPDAQVVKSLRDALSAYDVDLNARVESAQDDIKTQRGLLKDRVFKKQVSGSPELQALAATAAEAIDARSKLITERQRQVNAATKHILADLNDI